MQEEPPNEGGSFSSFYTFCILYTCYQEESRAVRPLVLGPCQRTGHGTTVSSKNSLARYFSLCHQGYVGGVIPQLIGFRPGGLLAQLQLEVGDAVPQEDQLPAPVGHVQLPLDGQVQGLLIKCSAAGQIQHPDADMVHGNHRMFLPLLDFCPHFTTEPEGGQGRSFFQKKGKSLYANRQKWGMI